MLKLWILVIIIKNISNLTMTQCFNINSNSLFLMVRQDTKIMRDPHCKPYSNLSTGIIATRHLLCSLSKKKEDYSPGSLGDELNSDAYKRQLCESTYEGSVSIRSKNCSLHHFKKWLEKGDNLLK